MPNATRFCDAQVAAKPADLIAERTLDERVRQYCANDFRNGLVLGPRPFCERVDQRLIGADGDRLTHVLQRTTQRAIGTIVETAQFTKIQRRFRRKRVGVEPTKDRLNGPSRI